MKKIRHFTLLLFVAMAFAGCHDEYDDSALRSEVEDLKSRVEKLEAWCDTANGQISALQGIVTALDGKDYVTGVTPIMEGSKEVGYTITFTKSKPITILHGAKGDKGDTGAAGKDAVAPVIGVKQDTDGHYYWTVKIGTAAATWMLDAEGNKIRTTGDKGDTGADGKPGEPGQPGKPGIDGHTPVLSVAEFEGRLYWQIDGRWLLHDNQKVPATGDKGDAGEQGPQGDAIFAEDGVDYESDPENVIFTLVDGTILTLPKASTVTVGFDSYEVFWFSSIKNQIPLVLPATLKQTDYTAIVATITNENGTGSDIQTRSEATENTWGVEISKPTFLSNGQLVAGSAKVTLTAPAYTKLSETAILKVTITDKKGKEFSVTRPVKCFDGTIVTTVEGQLSAMVSAEVTKLAVKGSIDASDFAFIRTLTALEVLDLSMTDLTEMPNRGLAFYDTPNTTLKRVILPWTVTAINDAAFANCQALELFDTENAVSLGQWAFENCYKLRSVRLGNRLTSIANSAFLNSTALASVDIPASVASLGRWVFQGCESLETITLHEGLRTLSQSTFFGCGVVSIRIPSTVNAIPDHTFQNCKKLERITMHDGISEIGSGAFLRCYSLKTVKIPAGVTVIRNNTFDECQSLQTVTFHDNITEMQERAFGYCINLIGDNPISAALRLPASLSVLGPGVFISCNSLLRVDMKETAVMEISSRVLAHCKKLVDVVLPDGLRTINEWAFTGNGLTNIILPAGVTSIGDYAFWECSNLRTVQCLPTSVPTFYTNSFDKSAKAGRALLIPRSSAAGYSALAEYFERTILFD